MSSLRSVKSSSQCLRRSPLVSPPILKQQIRTAWRLPRFKFTIFEPIPDKQLKVKVKHAKSFNPFRKPISHRDNEDEDTWVATPMNGMIPIVIVFVILWGFSEKYCRTLPVASDPQFGPMRYSRNPEAKHWGLYRYDIQHRPGRRHWDKDLTGDTEP